MFDIVKRICMTEKSAQLFQTSGKLTLEVAKDANKVVIRHAVEKIWDVKVEKVHVINTPGKTMRSAARRSYVRPGMKKAIITLKKGYSIDLPGQFEMMGVPESQPLIETEGK